MRLISWTLKALVFFTLFAFALNNQHLASVKWFFGVEWRAPMVFVVLAAFAAGSALGVVAMAPGWWRGRQSSTKAADAASEEAKAPGAGDVASPAEAGFPPRDGL